MAEYRVYISEGQDLVEGRAVDPKDLANQIRDIAGGLGDVFVTPFGLPLKSMEVALTIGAEGSVGFLGTGAKAKAEAAITLTFEKTEEKA